MLRFDFGRRCRTSPNKPCWRHWYTNDASTRQVRKVPDVRVTFEELKLKDGGAFKFNPDKFSLEGLDVTCYVEA